MHKKYLYLLVFLIYQYPFSIYSADIHQQRRLFYQARSSLLTGNYQQFEQLRERVKGYVLYPYLLYIKLQQGIVCQNTQEIDHFLTHYQQTPLSDKLRIECLSRSAKNGDWPRFIHYYRPTRSPMLQCYYLKALLGTHQKAIADQMIPLLWQAINVASAPCQAAFTHWEHSGKLDKELLFRKLEQAIDEDNTSLVHHLSALLSRAERRQLEHWFQIYHDPFLILNSASLASENKLNRRILLHGVRRLASTDPNKLAQNWFLLDRTYHWTGSEKQALCGALAIALARRADLSAGIWLQQIKPEYADTVLREWRVRHALLHGNWPRVLYWIRQLSPAEQRFPCWRYWRARALAETKKTWEARAIYSRLAKDIDYYAVLSSQRLKQAYRPLTRKAVGDMAALSQNAAIQRAKELYTLGLVRDAQDEWRWVLPSLSISQKQAAAQLAKRWSWYNLAIIGAAKANARNDLSLSFPMAYRPSVLEVAQKLHLNVAWIWAIVRQESAFMYDAQSSVGAQGLMQLMPHTGRMLARSLNLHQVDLLDIDLNLYLGSLYLKRLLERFDGNALLATAAYNVGPTRISRYQSLYKRLPQDVWVEILPWRETRDYIKNVSLARSIYMYLHTRGT